MPVVELSLIKISILIKDHTSFYKIQEYFLFCFAMECFDIMMMGLVWLVEKVSSFLSFFLFDQEQQLGWLDGGW